MQTQLYQDLPTVPLLYAVNQSANTSDISDFLAHKENKSLVPTAVPEERGKRESKKTSHTLVTNLNQIVNH